MSHNPNAHKAQKRSELDTVHEFLRKDPSNTLKKIVFLSGEKELWVNERSGDCYASNNYSMSKVDMNALGSRNHYHKVIVSITIN
jgi:hypothetical protein